MNDMSAFCDLGHLLTIAWVATGSSIVAIVVLSQFVYSVTKIGDSNFAVLSSLICTPKSTLIDFKRSLDRKLIQCHADAEGEEFNSGDEMEDDENNEVSFQLKQCEVTHCIVLRTCVPVCSLRMATCSDLSFSSA